LHPSGSYLLSASSDATWAFHDVRSGSRLASVENVQSQEEFTSMSIHPDGLILGTGTSSGTVRIWDIKSQQVPATFEQHTGTITSLAFSENGYFMATTASDKMIRLWDLRKLQCFLSLEVESVVNSLKFDFSGTYIGTASQDVR